MPGDVDVCVLAGVVYPSAIFDEALLSLYWDQIKPSEIDIVRRIAEIRNDTIQRLTSSSDLVFVCDPSKYLVSRDPSGKHVVELREPPSWFLGWVDPADTDVDFPAEAKIGLSHFLVCASSSRHPSEDTGERYEFKGGRYGLARRLQESVLQLYLPENPGICEPCREFLESIQFMSLGRVCQLVQWGINTGLIRYEDNFLMPAVCSKLPSAALAAKLFPALPIGSSSNKHPSIGIPITEEISSLAQLEELIERLCRDHDVYELPLSQLKKRLICEYAIVLNPSRLGFVKISDVVRELNNFELFTVGDNNAYLRCRSPSTCVSSLSAK